MSYDTRILDPATGAELADVGNMTSNVGALYRCAMPGPYRGGGRYAGVGESEAQSGLPGLSGLRCRDAAPILHAGIGVMLNEGNAMQAMEPANGWGTHAGALAHLCSILVACVEHPDGVIAVNW